MAMVFYFLIVLGFAVTLHELGHFLVAKWSGVKVERFSFGFGPKLLGVRRGDTEYVISPIPFGGYVKMQGDNPEEGGGERSGDFFAASPWKRILIVLAGPGMNFLLGFVIIYLIALFPGAQVLRSARIAAVAPHSLAANAGMQVGDRVVTVDGESIESWDALAEAFLEGSGSGRDELDLQVQRGDEVERLTVDLRPLQEDYAPVVGYVLPDSPAEAAGIEAGDRILQAEGRSVDSWQAMADVLSQRFAAREGGEPETLPTSIVWRTAGGQERTATIVPEIEANGARRSVFGIARYGLFELEDYVDYVWPTLADLGVRAWVSPVVGEVKKGSPAWEKGIRPGHLILAINGEPVDHWYQMASRIHRSFHPAGDADAGSGDSAAGKIETEPVSITWVKPDGAHETATIQPAAEWVPDLKGRRLNYAMIGIGPRMDRWRMGILGSAAYACGKVRDYAFQFVYILQRVIRGTISPKAIGGPIAIAQISGERGAWGWESLFNLIAMLSVSFAVINLVPIPILDGGHFIVYLVEGIRRKRLTVRQMELIQKIGLAILIPIIGLIFYNDIARYFPLSRLADLFKNLFN